MICKMHKLLCDQRKRPGSLKADEQSIFLSLFFCLVACGLFFAGLLEGSTLLLLAITICTHFIKLICVCLGR